MTTPLDYSPPNFPPGTTSNENEVAEGRRLGLLPNQGRPAIPFGTVFKDAAFNYPIPAADDHISGVPAWNMGGNDKYGTCGPTSLANYITMVYWNLLGAQVTVSDDAVFALYRASGNPNFNPVTDADDNGVDMNVMLTAATKVGLTVTYTGVTNAAVYGNQPKPVAGAPELVKPVAFGELSVMNLDQVRAGTAVLGGVELGVTLQVAQQQQTDSGLWDYSQSPVWGGHAIMGAAYTGRTEPAPDEEIITWQKPVGTTDNFIANQLSQVFAVVLPCHLTHPAFLAGVDVSKLATLYTELTGRPFPGVAPAPKPPKHRKHKWL